MSDPQPPTDARPPSVALWQAQSRDLLASLRRTKSDTPLTDAYQDEFNADKERTGCTMEVLEALEFARALERRVAELEADRARIDWLEANNVHIHKPDTAPPWSITISASGEHIREAIDAALSASSQQEGGKP